jgi:hypothetical protein
LKHTAKLYWSHWPTLAPGKIHQATDQLLAHPNHCFQIVAKLFISPLLFKLMGRYIGYRQDIVEIMGDRAG